MRTLVCTRAQAAEARLDDGQKKKRDKNKNFCLTIKTETHKDASPELKEKQSSSVAWSVIVIGSVEPIIAKWLMWELVPTCGRVILPADIIKSSARNSRRLDDSAPLGGIQSQKECAAIAFHSLICERCRRHVIVLQGWTHADRRTRTCSFKNTQRFGRRSDLCPLPFASLLSDKKQSVCAWRQIQSSICEGEWYVCILISVGR